MCSASAGVARRQASASTKLGLGCEVSPSCCVCVGTDASHNKDAEIIRAEASTSRKDGALCFRKELDRL